MAIYYVDPDGGDDAVTTAANSASTPWRQLRRALKTATGSDTIKVAASDAFSCVRGVSILNTAGLTIKPTTAGERVYFSGCHDISQDAVRQDLDDEVFFDSSPYPAGSSWTTYAGTPTAETDNQLLGSGCVLLNATGEGFRKSLTAHFYETRPTRLRILYKTTGGGILQVAVRDGTADALAFDFALSSWAAKGGTYYNNLPDTSGEWSEYLTPWIVGLTGGATPRVQIQLASAAGGETALVQKIEHEYKGQWDLHSGSTYVCRFRSTGLTNSGYQTSAFGTYHSVSSLNFWKCTQDQWDENGEQALELVRIASAASPLVSVPAAGELHFDRTNNLLYYTLLEGESIEDLHIEAGAGVGINLLAAATIVNPTVFCGAPYGIVGNHTTGTAIIERPVVVNCAQFAYQQSLAGTMDLHEPDFYNTQLPSSVSGVEKVAGDGYSSGTVGNAAAAVLYIRGGSAKWGGDDHYQSLGSGSMYLYGCTSIQPYSNDIELANDAGSATFHIKGFSGTGGSVNCFKDQSTAAGIVAGVMRNCVFGGSATMNFSPAHASSTWDVDASNMCEAAAVEGSNTDIANAVSAVITKGAAITVAYTDVANDLTPKSGSVMVGAGSKWWTLEQRPVGANGEPFPDFDIDAGGVQSTHSPHHPMNL